PPVLHSFPTRRSSDLSLINFPQSGAPTKTAIDLNPHINYSNTAGTDAERAKTLSILADIVRATDGTLYVAATGANKVGVLNAAGDRKSTRLNSSHVAI